MPIGTTNTGGFMFSGAISPVKTHDTKIVILGAGLAVSFLLLIADLMSPGINVAILYIPLFVVLAAIMPSRLVRFWAAHFILLTYLGYFLKWWDHESATPWAAYLTYRLVNRTLTAILLLSLGGLMSLHALRQSKLAFANGAHAADDTPDEFDSILNWAMPLLAAVLAVMLALAIAATDLLMPAKFNLPILYALPLVVMAWLGSRRLLWASFILLLALSFIGYLAGPSTAGEGIGKLLLTNRFLAAGVMLLITCFLHWRISLHRYRLGHH